MKELFTILFVLLLAGTSNAMSEAEYTALMRDQGFRALDGELNAAWKDASSLATGITRQALVREQKEWARHGRDEDIAAQMLQGKDKLRAARNATQDRAYLLGKYAEQLRSPATPVSVTGRVFPMHNEAGGGYGLNFSDSGICVCSVVVYYYFMENEALKHELDRANQTDELVTITGFLSIGSFDTERPISITRR
jgi:uncharacterized protein YecT (DUF1311 family)